MEKEYIFMIGIVGTLALILLAMIIVHLTRCAQIVWKTKPSGNCPVQAEGWFLGKYFYFRSRWDEAKIEFANSPHDWDEDRLLKRYSLYTSKDEYSAGWISKRFAYILIYKGCIKFLLKFKSNM